MRAPTEYGAVTRDAVEEERPLIGGARARVRKSHASAFGALLAVAGLAGLAMRRGARARAGIAPVYAVEGSSTFTVDVGPCAITSDLRAKNPEFFSSGVAGVRLARHNLKTDSFFEWEDALVMDEVPNQPAYRRKFSLTTNEVNFEYGFVLVNRRGDYLYEIGEHSSPIVSAWKVGESTCVQKYGDYFNRVRTLDANPSEVNFVFGSCESECPPPPPPPPSPPPPSPPPPESTTSESTTSELSSTYVLREGYTVVGNLVTQDAHCVVNHIFESSDRARELQWCENKCNACDACEGFVHHMDDNNEHCTFHSSHADEPLDNNDWYGKHAPEPAPETTPSDGKTDLELGMNEEPISDTPDVCTSCTAVFWEHYAPDYGNTGRVLGRIETISTYDNPTWTNIQYGTSSIVITGHDNCRVITDADEGYEFRKLGGRSGGSTIDGVYNYPLATGNDNINRATVVCASDTSEPDAALDGEAQTDTCDDCQVVFYEHYAPDHGNTGAILGSISMQDITTDLSNPKWVNLVNRQTSSAVMTGDMRCRFKSDKDTTYEYARAGSSGGGEPGVYNYPMATGNDVMTKAYMWCAKTTESNSDVA